MTRSKTNNKPVPNNINTSVQVPDSVIASLATNAAHRLPPHAPMKHLDLVIDGGGFSGSHLVGALAYMKHLRDNQLVHIRRVAGVSVGAISALLFQANMLNHAFHMYPSIRTHYAKHLNTAIVSDHLATILTHLDTHLPTFFRTCNLHISYFHVPSMKHIG